MAQLTITPYSITDLPTEDALLAAGKEILDSVTSWKAGKTFHDGLVRTFSRAKVSGDGAPWHYRVSEHAATEATFDDFAEKLCKDKPENEKNFIHSITKVTLIKKVSESQQIWAMKYEFPPPISPRIFTVLQTIHVDQTSPRTGMIVSVPVDLTSDAALLALEEKGVKGRYVSVERITELADGKTKWEMATSSTPGGNIPMFVSERSMDGQISNDVPLLLKYMKEHPAPATATQTAPTATISAPAAST